MVSYIGALFHAFYNYRNHRSLYRGLRYTGVRYYRSIYRRASVCVCVIIYTSPLKKHYQLNTTS